MSTAPHLKTDHTSLMNDFLEQAQEIILGKPQELRLMLTCIVANGHLLIEDVPGVGKTTFVKTLKSLSGLNYNRIQFTNDLLPSDIIGGSILESESMNFTFRKGPIFCQLLLADEINRATPKTQSACLQAMEEGMISIDGNTFDLPRPFFVVATQNPQSNIGTFPLPESQLDRFMMRINIGFPSREAEKALLQGKSRQTMIESQKPILSETSIIELQKAAAEVHVSEPIVDYIQDIIALSREKHEGLSPRAAIDIIQASKAYAFILGQDFVKPQDVQDVLVPVINHRLQGVISFKEGAGIAQELMEQVRIK